MEVLSNLQDLVVIVLLRAIWDFKEFDLIFLLTGGGPMNATKVYAVLAYWLARQRTPARDHRRTPGDAGADSGNAPLRRGHDAARPCRDRRTGAPAGGGGAKAGGAEEPCGVGLSAPDTLHQEFRENP